MKTSKHPAGVDKLITLINKYCFANYITPLVCAGTQTSGVIRLEHFVALAYKILYNASKRRRKP